MTKISFCILNYYEDWLVCRFIAQVYEFVDEIIIGDCSRGRDYLPRFIQGLPKCRIAPDPGGDAEGKRFSWAEWRNLVQSYAKGDWILWADPDELYPREMMKNLKDWLDDTNVEAVGFIRIAHATHKRIVKKSKEAKVRCWRNLRHIIWTGDIHENPQGFKDYEVWEIEYPHDIAWLPSFPQRIYKLKKREKRGNILPRIKKGDLDPYREDYPDEGEEEAFKSRE